MKKHLDKLNRKVQENLHKITMSLLLILLVVLIINSFYIFNSSSTLTGKVIAIQEFNKPLQIQIITIECNGCSDISSIVENIKNKNVDIIKEENLDSYSEKSKELIQKYDIKKLSSILIFGEINNDKIKFDDFNLINDALVLTNIKAPYFDLSANELKGDVKIIEIIDSSCEECIDMSFIPLSFGKEGILMSDWEKIEYDSEQGRQLINQHTIKEIPAILISEQINYYKDMEELMISLEAAKKQGFYKLHPINPPYLDLTTNKIIGLVDLIMLTDDSCTECYDVELNKRILQNFGVVIKDEKKYDITSNQGKQLISKYNIEKVPIIILSPEAEAYESLVNAWKNVGTIENDNWFIMRAPEIVGEITLVNSLKGGENET